MSGTGTNGTVIAGLSVRAVLGLGLVLAGGAFGGAQAGGALDDLTARLPAAPSAAEIAAEEAQMQDFGVTGILPLIAPIDAVPDIENEARDKIIAPDAGEDLPLSGQNPVAEHGCRGTATPKGAEACAQSIYGAVGSQEGRNRVLR